jgi:glutamate racemase
MPERTGRRRVESLPPDNPEGLHAMNRILLITILVGLMTLPPGSSAPARDALSDRIGRLVENDSITVLVTDSGLGGLSVCADIEARARRSGLYRQIRIIFANALPESNRGYNKMKTTAEKVKVFDDALEGMTRCCSPDVILVACNTLSVLIPQTRFVAADPLPVVGIVEAGVDMLYERLSAEPNSTAIIFGTETTIGAGTHRSLLMERGIDSVRLVSQACPNLAGEIEADAKSDVVESAVDLFVSEALSRVTRADDMILAGLCCTHYGYVGSQFAEALKNQGVRRSVVVDPNARMSDALFPQGKLRRTDSPAIRVEVISRAVISPGEIASIGSLVETVSPATAEALKVYTLKRDLFPYTPLDQ